MEGWTAGCFGRVFVNNTMAEALLGKLWYKDAIENYPRGLMKPNRFLEDQVRVVAWGNNGKSLQQKVSICFPFEGLFMERQEPAGHWWLGSCPRQMLPYCVKFAERLASKQRGNYSPGF